MENFKWKNAIAVGVVVVIIALVAYVKFMGVPSFISDSNTNSSTTASTNNGSPTTTSPTLQTVNTVDNSSTVGIQSPPEPTNGRVRSVTMIGPSGAFNALTKTDGRSFKLLKKGFIPMLINEGAVSTEDIKKVINEYIAQSWNNKEYPVTSNGDIQIVIASSVVNNPKVQAALPELKKTYVVTTTTSEIEGSGAFKVAVASQYQSTAIVMDITPTIVRFPTQVNGVVKTFVAKTGSKYYQNGQTKEQALAEIRATLAQMPLKDKQLVIVLWSAAEKDLRQGTNRYSAIPNYSGNERSTISGLELVNEVKNITNANVVFDFDSQWYQAY